MGCGIAAIAIGIARIIVLPRGVGGDGLFQQDAEIVEQRVLPFVHKDRSGGVERLNHGDAVMDAAFANQLPRALARG